MGNKGISIDVSSISANFTRALPKNLLEISQIVANLWGKVSKKTLLAQVPFVDDVEVEIQMVEKEEQERIEKQRQMFGSFSNTPPEDVTEGTADE